MLAGWVVSWWLFWDCCAVGFDVFVLGLLLTGGNCCRWLGVLVVLLLFGGVFVAGICSELFACGRCLFVCGL